MPIDASTTQSSTRRLRLGMVGGGPGGFIGAVHRIAARIDDRWELVAGALSSNPDRARAAVKDAGLAFHILDERMETIGNKVCVATMHLAKGLEFRAVVVMACDDEIIPLQSRVEAVTDDADLQDVYNTERHLLYVACTRARDHLLISSVDPASEFLGDLNASPRA